MADPIEVLGAGLQTLAVCTSPEAATAAARLLGAAWLRDGSKACSVPVARPADDARGKIADVEVELAELRRIVRESVNAYTVGSAPGELFAQLVAAIGEPWPF